MGIENQLSDVQLKHFFEVTDCVMKEVKFEHFLIQSKNPKAYGTQDKSSIKEEIHN